MAGFRKNPETTRRYHFEEEFPPLILTGEEIRFLAPVTVDILLERVGKVFPLKGLINSKISRACGRCLQLVEHSVRVEFELAYVHRNDLEEIGIQVEPGQEPEDYEVFEDRPIEIREIVLENIIMSMPMSFICQPGCKGLCPQCGRDLNQEECNCQPDVIDPRLAILQELLKTKP